MYLQEFCHHKSNSLNLATFTIMLEVLNKFIIHPSMHTKPVQEYVVIQKESVVIVKILKHLIQSFIKCVARHQKRNRQTGRASRQLFLTLKTNSCVKSTVSKNFFKQTSQRIQKAWHHTRKATATPEGKVKISTSKKNTK